MQVELIPRSTWTSRVPDNNSGTPRPLLQPNRPLMTGHYTGVSWHLSSGALRYQPFIGAPTMTHIEHVADAGLKSFEYNYVIPVGNADLCHIWEYAGLYQAAHSQGENHLAIGVLLLLGVDNYGKPGTLWQPISPAQIYGLRWLRRYLVESGVLSTLNLILPHREMEGANTICPGIPTIEAWPQVEIPLVDKDPDMADYIEKILIPNFNDKQDWWPWLAEYSSGVVRVATGQDVGPQVPCHDRGQYMRLCHQNNIQLTHQFPIL